MARRLYLARHGQAGGQNYNKLTPAGETQARALGDYFAAEGLRMDRAAHGSLGRQRETYELFAERYGAGAPAADELPGLDEITPEIWFGIGEELRHDDQNFRDQFREWLSSLRDSEKRGVSKEAYISVLRRILETWVAGNYERTDIPSFAQFHADVRGAFAQLTERLKSAADGEQHIAISSGTPIALMVGDAFGLDLPRSLRLMRFIQNTSVSVFQYSEELDALEVVNFNGTPHLSKGTGTDI